MPRGHALSGTPSSRLADMASNIEGQFQEHFWGSWDQKEMFRHRAATDLIRRGPVLDVGAGDGFFLELLKKKRGIQGKGVDLSAVASEKAAQKGIEVCIADLALEDLPFEDASFATVVLLDVIEHLFQPELLLAKAAKKSSSDIIVSVPNFSSLPARLQALLGRVPENNTPRKGHVYWFTWEKLKKMLEAEGFEIVDTRFNSNFTRFPFVGGIFRWLAMRRPSLFALSFVVRAEKRV